MKTDGGWISVSEAARLYGKSRKWVYDQIERYGLDTQKEGNRTRLRLVDLIAHRGEPEKGAPGDTVAHTENSQKNTPDTELLKQENQFLHLRVEELEADRAERKHREERLQGIIERQTLALPHPERKGLTARLADWIAAR